MSIPDGSGGAAPGEIGIVGGQLPKPTDVPATPTPTPGVSLAGARVPGGPTLPDWDPSSLTSVVSRLANDLFTPLPGGAPAAAPPPTTIPTDAEAPIAATPGSAPTSASPPSSGATVPSAPIVGPPAASPFAAPLRFDGLEDFAGGESSIGSFPVVDGGPHSPLDSAAPYWMAPSKQEAEPPTTGIAFESFQIEPVSDHSLRSGGGTAFDPHAIRREFPILQERVHGHRLVWLDNGATTQKPQVVIDRLKYFYEHENSNIHRAAHTLAGRATDAYESAREAVRRFINAPSKNDIVFVRGTTEGINLLSQSWGRRNIHEGDEILITWLEHHANIVPWQRLAAERGARLRVAPVDDRGQVILEEYDKLLCPRTRLVAFSQVSNALGTVTPAKEMIELAHRRGAVVVLDGAQSVSHMPVDVQDLDCDFFVFSGHKVFGPTGIGAVFGKGRLLEEMPPWQGGGNMIQDVTFERTTYQGPPARFEAGTGNIADAIGLGTALDWLSRIGLRTVERYEHELLEYATERLRTVPGLTMIGTAREKAGVMSFILAGQKTEEVGGLLDKEGIAVRSGHHCAQPILRRFGLEATVRASLALYNTCEDIDALVAALRRLQLGHAAP